MQSTYNGIPDGVSIGSQLPAQSNGCAARWPGNPVNLTAGFKRARPRARTAFKVNPFANPRGRPPRNCLRRFVQLERARLLRATFQSRPRFMKSVCANNSHTRENKRGKEILLLTRPPCCAPRRTWATIKIADEDPARCCS